jgi:hypothetical protein
MLPVNIPNSDRLDLIVYEKVSVSLEGRFHRKTDLGNMKK